MLASPPHMINSTKRPPWRRGLLFHLALALDGQVLSTTSSLVDLGVKSGVLIDLVVINAPLYVLTTPGNDEDAKLWSIESGACIHTLVEAVQCLLVDIMQAEVKDLHCQLLRWLKQKLKHQRERRSDPVLQGRASHFGCHSDNKCTRRVSGRTAREGRLGCEEAHYPLPDKDLVAAMPISCGRQTHGCDV